MSLSYKIPIACVSVLILILSLSFVFDGCSKASCMQEKNEYMTVSIGKADVKVEIASTSDARMLGLGGRGSLADGYGMLFIFEKSDLYGFWMKDVPFALDIIWIDKDKVISIEKNVTPGSFPQVFYPKLPANLVLEVSSGFVDKHSLKIGDNFYLNP